MMVTSDAITTLSSAALAMSISFGGGPSRNLADPSHEMNWNETARYRPNMLGPAPISDWVPQLLKARVYSEVL